MRKNLKNNKKQYSDEELLKSLQTSSNINEAVQKLKSKVSKHDYYRAINLMNNYHIKFSTKKNIEEIICIHCGKVLKNKNNSMLCRKCFLIQSRKAERPPLEQLIKEVKELGFCGTGRKYGVSDNAIRKWIKNQNE